VSALLIADSDVHMGKVYVIAAFAMAAIVMVNVWAGTRNLDGDRGRSVPGITTGVRR
jgi:hypothetical protein